MAHWSLLREKLDVIDDIDVALVQDSSGLDLVHALATLSGDKGNLGRLVVVFFDVSNKPVADDRGSFDLRYIEIIFQRDRLGKLLSNTLFLVDSVVLEEGQGYRCYAVDSLVSATIFTVTFTNVVPPLGAVSMRVYLRVP